VEPTQLEILATVTFGLAILHTFAIKRFEHIAHRYPQGSVGENLFHLLGEVEIVFGLWAGVLLICMTFMVGEHDTIAFLEGNLEGRAIHFTEPAFVFVVMSVAATRPILQAAKSLITAFGRLLPLGDSASFFFGCLALGPVLGSFITEPAAMTVTALLLKERFYERGMSKNCMYATLGVLFVNVSIGGTLTHFAAPPVLMVAGKWEWGISFMTTHFGWKAVMALLINTIVLTTIFYREITVLGDKRPRGSMTAVDRRCPIWLVVLHMLCMVGIVYFAHHMVVFFGIFMLFLGITTVTTEFQDPLKLKEGLLVGFFLAGLVILGAFQSWWLQPMLEGMGETALFDNAALTYLGSMVDGISDPSKYALVAGAVAGGGLTVIANAPNPAGFGILKGEFGDEGISPLGLLLNAIPPTIVSMLCFWYLPHLG
jgi:hypothetical protein